MHGISIQSAFLAAMRYAAKMLPSKERARIGAIGDALTSVNVAIRESLVPRLGSSNAARILWQKEAGA